MSAHTPGPWQVEATTLGTVEDMDGLAIAQAFQVRPRDKDLKQIERKANARLIAAAPDLLAALQLAGYSAGYQYMTDETRAVISAAIAKATGAEP